MVATYLWRLRSINFKRVELNASHFVTSRRRIEQRDLYSRRLSMACKTAASIRLQPPGVIELAEQPPAPGLAPVGLDAEERLRLVREKPSMIA